MYRLASPSILVVVLFACGVGCTGGENTSKVAITLSTVGEAAETVDAVIITFEANGSGKMHQMGASDSFSVDAAAIRGPLVGNDIATLLQVENTTGELLTHVLVITSLDENGLTSGSWYLPAHFFDLPSKHDLPRKAIFRSADTQAFFDELPLRRGSMIGKLFKRSNVRGDFGPPALQPILDSTISIDMPVN